MIGCLIILWVSVCEGFVHITPNDKLYWVKYSRPITLVCDGDRNVSWYKDNKEVVSNDDVTVNKHRTYTETLEQYQTKLQIDKANTAASGNYSCSDGTNYRSIDFKVVKGHIRVYPVGRIVASEDDSLTMICEYEGDSNLDVTWYKYESESLASHGFVSNRRTVSAQRIKTTLETVKQRLKVVDSGVYYCSAGPYFRKVILEVVKDPCSGTLMSRISDESMTASSFYKDILHDDSPYCARLNNTTKPTCGGWSPIVMNTKQWIQVSFSMFNVVRYIITQGRSSIDSRQEWVKSYRLTYSQDGAKWNKYRGRNGKILDFEANFEKSVVTTRLPVPIVAKFIRIHPMTWNNRIALRFDLVGCLLPAKISILNEDNGKLNIRIPDPLELTCNYSGPQVADFVWYKDNNRITERAGFTQTYDTTWLNDKIISTAAISKNKTKYSDSGKYICVERTTQENKSLSVYAAQLEMKPAFKRLWALTDTRLEISCEFTGTHSKRITWKVNDNTDLQRSGFYVSTNTKLEHAVSRTTSIVTKDKISLVDSFNLTCSCGDFVRRTEVVIISGTGRSKELVSGKDLVLTCDVENTNIKYSFEIYWTKNYIPLNLVDSMKGRYSLNSDTTGLTIRNTDITDAGHFECNILLEVGTSEQQHLTIPIEVNAKPEVVLEGQSQIKAGETLHFYCKVSGYPVPVVTWYKDGVAIPKDVSRYSYLPYSEIPNGHLVLFDVRGSDKGKYTCKGEVSQFPPVSSKLFINVKEEPISENLLLICVIVSCTAIVVVIICCAACFRCQKKQKQPVQHDTPTQNKPLLTRRYVEMQVLTRDKCMTSLEEIDKLPPPPPPIDPSDDDSIMEDISLTYERIPRIRDRQKM